MAKAPVESLDLQMSPTEAAWLGVNAESPVIGVQVPGEIALSCEWVLDRRGYVIGFGLAAAAFGLSACSQATLEQWSPEGLTASAEPLKRFISSWGLRIGLGIVYGAATGTKAFLSRRDAGENKEMYLGAIEKSIAQIEDMKAKGVPRQQVKMLEEQKKEYQRLINPVWSAWYVMKEAGEGVLAGSTSQFAWETATDPDSDVIKSGFMIVNAIAWNIVAWKK